MKNKPNTFNRSDLLKLFLIVAFTPHVWTLLMAFRDVDWVAESRMVSGAIGFTAYVLTLSLIESLFLFCGILLLGLLISKKWSKDQRLASLGLVALILSSWSILEQVTLVLLFDKLVKLLSSAAVLGARPWIGFIFLGIFVTLSFVIPLYFVLRSKKFSRFVLVIFDRFAILSGFYLFLDLIAIIILIIRNV